MGRICMACWGVLTAQSISFFKSPKSPTPKLPSLRNEKTGMAVPATLRAEEVKRTSDSGVR